MPTKPLDICSTLAIRGHFISSNTQLSHQAMWLPGVSRGEAILVAFKLRLKLVCTHQESGPDSIQGGYRPAKKSQHEDYRGRTNFFTDPEQLRLQCSLFQALRKNNQAATKSEPGETGMGDWGGGKGLPPQCPPVRFSSFPPSESLGQASLSVNNTSS